MTDLLEYIPPVLRKPDGPRLDLLENVALMNLLSEGHDIEVQIGFLEGMGKHLSLVGDPEKDMGSNKTGVGYRWYSETLKDVEIITREINDGFVLGKKARLIFESDETIDTGWIEFNAFVKDASIYWDMALSRTIKKMAEEGIGSQVSVMKHVWNDGGQKGGRRECIDLVVYQNSENKSSESNNDSEDLTIKSARQIAKNLKIEYGDFEKELKGFIADINSGDVRNEDDVYKFVSDEYRIKLSEVEDEADLDIFDEYKDQGKDFQLLALGIDLLDKLLED